MNLYGTFAETLLCSGFAQLLSVFEMKFSHLAAVITLLLASYGPVEDHELTDWQEDCAGSGLLTQGVLLFGLKGFRRDVS